MEKTYKETKSIEVDMLEDILCDMCGNSCRSGDYYNRMKLYAHWGYDSAKDGEFYIADVCETCVDKVLVPITKFRKTP